MKVATEFPHVTKKFFEAKGIHVHVVEVSGATEITPHIGVADAIVDLTSSGTTLSINHLKVDRARASHLAEAHREQGQPGEER